MGYYKKYIVTNRFRGKAICGNINLPYGTECDVVDLGKNEKAIVCSKGVICYVTSQTAYDYFSQNDDGNGEKRGQLVKCITKCLSNKNDKNYQKNWDKVWDDTICQKYKRPDFEDHWLWNYDFYNAPLFDLLHIANLVGIKQ